MSSLISTERAFPHPLQKPTLTIEEAARWLGLSRGSAYEGAKEFERTNGASGLPVRRIGSRLFVPTAALWEWLDLDWTSPAPLRHPEPQRSSRAEFVDDEPERVVRRIKRAVPPDTDLPHNEGLPQGGETSGRVLVKRVPPARTAGAVTSRGVR